MTNDIIYQKLLEIVKKDKVFANEPMSKHTTFKIGGNADFLVLPTQKEEIKMIIELCRRNNVKLTVIGNGSNTLVKDGGIRGITIKVDSKKIEKEVCNDGMIYTCGAGVPITLVARNALEDGLTGMEFAYGIPGSLGGAIYMNAGAYGGEIKNVVLETTYIDMDGDFYTINNEEHEFEYRSSIFQKIDSIIFESKLKLTNGVKKEIESKMNENMEQRKSKQPLEYGSAGSVFKRGDGFIAAKLIDDCGLKGTKIGGAEISEKHAGFIINKGEATAKDVLELIKFVKTVVKEKTGFNIVEEIKMIGED